MKNENDTRSKKKIISEHKDEINNYQFENVYLDLTDTLKDVHLFTRAMLKIGVDPAEHLGYIPNNYLSDSESTLKSYNIPNNVTSIGEYAFYNCSGLTSITIPDSVTSIGWGAFGRCPKIKSITIPNSVTYIEDEAFSKCIGLKSITIGNSVKRIGLEAFFNCRELENITIPDSVTYIGTNAFYACSKLKEVTYTGTIQQWKEIKNNSDYELNKITIHCTDGDIVNGDAI